MAGGARDEDDGTVTGINVTPLVDITLVLLIIMMVTAKIIVSQALPLELPKAATGQQVQLVFGIEVRTSGAVTIDGKAIAADTDVLDRAKEALERNKELKAVIRAENTVPHGKIMRVLDLLRQAGVTKIAFGITPVAAEPGAVLPGPEAPKPVAPKKEEN
ncbi:MAG: biopolymer transporter ExbD [Myxococcales bacterium]|nr:biopolymer transporter ExbD [Myxococcales bacterium]